MLLRSSGRLRCVTPVYFVVLGVSDFLFSSELTAAVPDADPESRSQFFAPVFSVFHVILLILVFVIFYLLFRAPIFAGKNKLSGLGKLRHRLAASEMRALRNEMNPHFIFNAINSIQHYVLTNEKELANKYLVKFSRLMRNILELSKEELITVKDELETAHLYLEIESLRFNNAFEFSIACEQGIDITKIMLPPLLIQPFVENAIWHGLLLKEGRRCLEIGVKRKGDAIAITVDDNGIGREMAGKFNNRELKRKSFGLNITNDRLAVLKQMHGVNIAFEVTDKKENGVAAGTLVTIEMKNKN